MCELNPKCLCTKPLVEGARYWVCPDCLTYGRCKYDS